MPVVIDSSALVELLIQTRTGARGHPGRRDHRLVAPDVVNPEVLSALRRLERSGSWRPAGSPGRRRPAGRPGAAVLDLPLMAEAWTLRANVTATDACYVVLARTLHARWSPATGGCSRAPGLGVPLLTV